MGENIYVGYLIKKLKYSLYDEILIFLSKNGRKFTCLSKGSLKSESKNARNLFLGSLIEFQIFESRTENKISRLKKATLIKQFTWELENDWNFKFLNKTVNKVNIVSTCLYKFYEKILSLIEQQEINVYDITNIIYFELIIIYNEFYSFKNNNSLILQYLYFIKNKEYINLKKFSKAVKLATEKYLKNVFGLLIN